MRIPTICLLALLLALIHTPANAEIVIEVNPRGELPTITAARDHIRARRAVGEWLDTPITVMINPSTYYLPEPIVFGPEDSGTADAPVVYRQVEDADGSIIISGGRRITGWRAVEVNGVRAWAVDLPDVRAGKWYFRQLFVNGQRCSRPRVPKAGFHRFTAVPDLKPKQGYRPGQFRANFAPGHIANWKNLSDVEIVILHYWVSPRMQIARVDESDHLVEFTKPTLRRLTDSFNAKQFARFYADNVFEALDEPGEWYLDRPTGTLYYVPRPGETPNRTTVIAPWLKQLVRVGSNAKDGEPTRFIELRGLTLQHAEAIDSDANAADGQASSRIAGGVAFHNSENCSLRDCRVGQVSGYAVEIGAGCENIAVESNVITDLGAGGIKLWHSSNRSTVANNEIAHGGRYFHNAVGVLLGQSHENTVAHNHIHDFYYTGVSVGWSWGYAEPSRASGNVIEYNHIHDIGQGMLSDMAGVYTLGVSPGTIVRTNLIHDVEADIYGGWGLYCDEGSSYILMENNVVYRTTHGGFHQHYGSYNVIRNNVFAFGKHAQIKRSREEKHTSFTFERNIVCFNEGKLLGGNWKNDDYRIDYNVYWREDGDPMDFTGESFEDWQKRGHDRHSIIADPLFEAPEDGNFTLEPKSPAIKLGFKPIDTTKIGRLKTP